MSHGHSASTKDCGDETRGDKSETAKPKSLRWTQHSASKERSERKRWSLWYSVLLCTFYRSFYTFLRWSVLVLLHLRVFWPLAPSLLRASLLLSLASLTRSSSLLPPCRDRSCLVHPLWAYLGHSYPFWLLLTMPSFSFLLLCLHSSSSPF